MNCLHTDAGAFFLRAVHRPGVSPRSGHAGFCGRRGTLQALQAKTDTNKPSRHGLTPVAGAAKKGHVGALRVLLQATCDVADSGCGGGPSAPCAYCCRPSATCTRRPAAGARPWLARPRTRMSALCASARAGKSRRRRRDAQYTAWPSGFAWAHWGAAAPLAGQGTRGRVIYARL